MEYFLFLAQQAQGVNVGAGTIMLYAELACLVVIAIGAFEFFQHKTMLSLGVILITVILAASAPGLVRLSAHFLHFPLHSHFDVLQFNGDGHRLADDLRRHPFSDQHGCRHLFHK